MKAVFLKTDGQDINTLQLTGRFYSRHHEAFDMVDTLSPARLGVREYSLEVYPNRTFGFSQLRGLQWRIGHDSLVGGFHR